jgi:DeoR/GlpR family transcriptional regulator of sugar metabolism
LTVSEFEILACTVRIRLYYRISHINQTDMVKVRTSRHSRIEQLLEMHGGCSVEDLARELHVSDMTIRRDLQRLAQAGRLVRTHGGAAPAAQVMFEFQFLRRSRQHKREKEQIGVAAAKLIGARQSVLLDSGTTTLALARQLCNHQGLTIITTSLPIAAALQHAPGVQTVLLGGLVRRDTPDLGGPLTESNLENLRADLAFVGADGIDLAGNVYNGSIETARMLSKMIGSASAGYVVADSSKIGRTALMQYANAGAYKGLITDSNLAAEQLDALKGAGVCVIVAGQRQTTRENELPESAGMTP